MIQTDVKTPTTFIVSRPVHIEPVIPSDPQAAAQIRAAILRFFALQIASKIIEQSTKG